MEVDDPRRAPGTRPARTPLEAYLLLEYPGEPALVGRLDREVAASGRRRGRRTDSVGSPAPAEGSIRI